MKRFSFFLAPVSNVVPHKTVGIEQIYNVIRGDYYRAATEELRSLIQGEGVTQRDVQRFKARNFDYATFSGEFSRRREDALLAHSGLLCLDFDHISRWQGGGHLQGVYGLRYALAHDASVDTALLFRSPGGDGLKWGRARMPTGSRSCPTTCRAIMGWNPTLQDATLHVPAICLGIRMC